MTEQNKYSDMKSDEELSAYAEWQKMFLTPDFKEKYPGLLSKEMKSSNIKRGDMEWIENALDVAFQISEMGDSATMDFLMYECQKKLCLSNSLDGFFQMMQQTQIRREILSEDSKKNMVEKMFSKKGKEA